MNFNVTPIYKNREKRIFVFCVHLDPPHWPSNFENHHYRVKNQNCRRPLEWPIKTSAREALGQWKKLELNRTYQFGEKSQKPSKIPSYIYSGIFGWFLGFFSKTGTSDWAQTDLPVWRKISTTLRKYSFSEKWYFRVVFGIFQQFKKTKAFFPTCEA